MAFEANISLNRISDSIMNTLGIDINNYEIKEKIKFEAIQFRALLLRRDLEKRAIVFSGGQSLFGDATLQWAKGFTSRVDTSCNTYDMYFTTFVPDIQLSSTVGSATKGEPILLAAAFPSGAYSAGDNQYDYDVLIKALGQFTTDASNPVTAAA